MPQVYDPTVGFATKTPFVAPLSPPAARRWLAAFSGPVAAAIEACARSGATYRGQGPWRRLASLRSYLNAIGTDDATTDAAVAEAGRRVGLVVRKESHQ